MQVQSYKESLNTKGYAHLCSKSLFDDEQLKVIDQCVREVPKETVRIGDVGEQNFLSVGRFMNDKKGTRPTVVNEKYANDLLSVLSSSKAARLFRDLVGGDFYIRRCQVNVMSAGSYIGLHTDTDSNYDYMYSVVLQLSDNYEGGSFFIDFAGEREMITTKRHELLVNRCEIPHGVDTVTRGDRATLVFFLSRKGLDIKNENNKQI